MEKPLAKLEITSRGPEETESIGTALARALRPGDWLLLAGELGAGKTVLVRGLVRALDCPDRVTSPTFCLIQSFEGSQVLHHLDLYRLESLHEIADLGLEELAQEGVLAIEWAEKLGPLAPEQAVRARLAYGEGPDERLISLEGPEDFIEYLQATIGGQRLACDPDYR